MLPSSSPSTSSALLPSMSKKRVVVAVVVEDGGGELLDESSGGVHGMWVYWDVMDFDPGEEGMVVGWEWLSRGRVGRVVYSGARVV